MVLKTNSVIARQIHSNWVFFLKFSEVSPTKINSFLYIQIINKSGYTINVHRPLSENIFSITFLLFWLICFKYFIILIFHQQNGFLVTWVWKRNIVWMRRKSSLYCIFYLLVLLSGKPTWGFIWWTSFHVSLNDLSYVFYLKFSKTDDFLSLKFKSTLPHVWIYNS